VTTQDIYQKKIFFISLTEVRAREIIVDIRIIAIDDDNNRTNFFDDEWTAEFGDKIQSELNGNQFVALRTRTKPNPIKAGFETHRFTLEKWPDIANWVKERVKESPVLNRMGSIGLISIDAQRDIHQDLTLQRHLSGLRVQKVFEPALSV